MKQLEKPVSVKLRADQLREIDTACAALKVSRSGLFRHTALTLARELAEGAQLAQPLLR